LKIRIEENNLELEDYENIFYGEIEELKDNFDSAMIKHNIEWKRFWWGLGIGFISGIVGSVLIIFLT